jgi:hypothetical protein
LPQIVEGIGPGGIARESRVGGIEAEGLDRADRLALGVFEIRAGPVEGGGHHLLQFFGIDADALARAFEYIPKVIEVPQQASVAGAFLVVHLGAGARQSFGVGFGIDRFGKRGGAAAFDAARVEPIGDALLDDLAYRPELGPDRFGLADERRQDDVLFALRVDEIAAKDLGSAL